MTTSDGPRADRAEPDAPEHSAEETASSANVEGPGDTIPGTTVSSGAWSQFQRRMQLRREATCVGALRRAMDAGDYAAALDRATELAEIDPTWSELKLFLAEMSRSPAPASAAAAPRHVPEPTVAAASGSPAAVAVVPAVAARSAFAPNASQRADAGATADRPAGRAGAGTRSARRAVFRVQPMLVLLVLGAAALGGWTLAQKLPASFFTWWVPSPFPDAAPPSQVQSQPRAQTMEPGVPVEVPRLPPAAAEPTPPLAQPHVNGNAFSQKRHADAPDEAQQPRQEHAAAPPVPKSSEPRPEVRSSTSSLRPGSGTPDRQPLLVAPDTTAEIRTPSSPQQPPPPVASLPQPPPAPAPTLPSPAPSSSAGAAAEPPRESPTSAPGATPAPERAATSGTSERAAVERPDDERAINETLGAYADAYMALDAAAVKRVWPAVNAESLGSAFGQLQSQRILFYGCAVEVRGLHASASCRGVARYVPKVGSREPVSVSRVWQFSLRKRVDDWVIESVK